MQHAHHINELYHLCVYAVSFIILALGCFYADRTVKEGTLREAKIRRMQSEQVFGAAYPSASITSESNAANETPRAERLPVEGQNYAIA